MIWLLALLLLLPTAAWAQSIGAMTAASQTPGVSLQPTIPTGAVGDAILCATITTANGVSATAPIPPAHTPLFSGEGTAGWLRVGGASRELGVADLNMTVFYKIATATSEGTPSFRYEVLAGGIGAACMRYATVRPITTVAVVATSSSPAATAWVPPAVTTTTANERVLTFVVSKNVNALALGTANGFALKAGGVNYQSTAGDAEGFAFGLADVTQAAAGAVPMPTWTQTAGPTAAWIGLTLTLVSSASPTAYGIAGPDQSMAEGLPVLLGVPEKAGTAYSDTDAGHTFHWRQIIVGSEPYVKLSHIDNTTTMFIAPEVTTDTLFRFGLTRDSDPEDTVDITVVNLPADSPSNTTFIDGLIVPATCTTYDPATRACGSGTYNAMKSTWHVAWFPLPAPGWRYVFRAGTYSYLKNNNPGGNSCWGGNSPVVRIEGTNAANGTPTAPVQFKTYNNAGTYESVLINMGAAPECTISHLFWVAGSTYVIVEGFELSGVTTTAGNGGRLVTVGAAGWLAAGPSPLEAAPSHHVTFRHMKPHDHGVPGSSLGLFDIPGPSHEIAFQYIEGYNGNAGMTLGVTHLPNKARLPYNVFLHTVYMHDNVGHPGNSRDFSPQGSRNLGVYKYAGTRNADGGMATQGPHSDSMSFWDVVSFGNDSSLSPAFDPQVGNYGNERGMQLGTTSATLADFHPFWRANVDNRVYRTAIFDHFGNGMNISGGANDARIYNTSLLNNCRRRSALTSFAQVFVESWAGTGQHYMGSPGPNTTFVNLASYWPRSNGCQNSVQQNWGYNVGLLGGLVTVTTSSPQNGGNPNFVVGSMPVTPFTQDAPASGVVVDTTLYTNAATRTLNPAFGTVNGLGLQSTSNLIDAGTFVAGVHCAQADDAAVPYPAGDPNCIHWRGNAPDIGAFEAQGSASLPGSKEQYRILVR